ncbi:MAG: ribosomal protein L7/L12 [Adlercreutzia equolifaciens]
MALPPRRSPTSTSCSSFGDNKIVIKVYPRDHRPGPEGAKGGRRGAPKAVAEGVNKEKAEEIKGKLEEAGAAVTLK